MKVLFDYGKNGLEIELDPNWNVSVLQARQHAINTNPIEDVKIAIEFPVGVPPLKEIIKQKGKLNQCCIVVSDGTRPCPTRTILEGLIPKLNEYGIEDNKILILIATGLHRPSREEELDRILGKEFRKRFKVIDHVATDKESLVYLGETSSGVPAYINKHYFESELKILTGYVEPHFFFGFSGGRKSLVPGIAGAETIQANHSAENIASKFSRFGIYEENPMHKISMEITGKVGVDIAINVCINERHQIIGIAAGDVDAAHKICVRQQLSAVFQEIKEPFDIVVCGNGGYPLDLNLYQAVKSMAIGEMAVKEGGTIISVNECSDGVGQEKFQELINLGLTPKEIHDKVMNKEIVVPDQWEIQVLARVMMKAEVIVVSTMTENELGNIGLKHSNSVEEAIKQGLEHHGENATILILPNGPQVLPKLRK